MLLFLFQGTVVGEILIKMEKVNKWVVKSVQLYVEPSEKWKVAYNK